jgi:hypothetical protein
MTEPDKTARTEAPPNGTPLSAATPRSPFLKPGTPPSVSELAPMVTKAGVATTRLVATSSRKIADGLGDKLRAKGVADGAATKVPPGSGTLGQLVNLAFGFSQVFSYGVFRFVEMLAGPLEQLIAPDTTIHNDAQLVLGPVQAGERVEGSFNLENASAYDAEVSVVLPNSLASVRGHIPSDRVVFTPNPSSIPASGSLEVRVQVNVPTSTAPGGYLGIVRSDEIPGLVLILEVDVA